MTLTQCTMTSFFYYFREIDRREVHSYSCVWHRRHLRRASSKSKFGNRHKCLSRELVLEVYSIIVGEFKLMKVKLSGCCQDLTLATFASVCPRPYWLPGFHFSPLLPYIRQIDSILVEYPRISSLEYIDYPIPARGSPTRSSSKSRGDS